MIQRIQTVFLLIVVFLSGILLFCNLVTFAKGQEVLALSLTGINNGAENIVSTWPLLALNLIILAIALVTIFQYKNRILQIRISAFNIVLMVGFYLLFAFYYFKTKEDGMLHSFSIALLIPFCNIIFTYLAMRAIGKDEALIRSLNRLR